MLRIQNLTKRYGSKTAVDDLSLQLDAGEICAFIGHNGCLLYTSLRISCQNAGGVTGKIDLRDDFNTANAGIFHYAADFIPGVVDVYKRQGVASVKGLAMTRNIPCAGVSTLRAMAENARGTDCIVCAVMDARCGQVYNAMFRVKGEAIERLCEDRTLPISELYAECAAYGDQLVLVGDGAALCYRTFAAFGAKIMQPQLQFQRASGVALSLIHI